MLKNSIGLRIKSLRRQMGLSQLQFAKKIGVSRVTVAYWELSKTTPKPHLLQQLARVTHKPITYFIPVIPSKDVYSLINNLQKQIDEIRDEIRLRKRRLYEA